MPILRLPPRSRPTDAPRTIDIRDLTGGVDLNTTSTRIAADRATRGHHWQLDHTRALTVALGSLAKIGPEAEIVQGGVRAYLADGPVTVIAINGELFLIANIDTNTIGSAVSTGLNDTNSIAFAYDRVMVIAFDGEHNPIKSLDGTTWSRLGIAAPTVAPTVTAVAGGTLINGSNYGFSYAYRNSATGFTSNESVEDQEVMAGANLTGRVAVTASGDAQVTHIVVYARNVTAGESVRREAAVVANTTGNVDITTENWDDEDEAFIAHDPPLPARFGVFWKNRLWMADVVEGNRLRFTDLFLPESSPTATFYVDLPLLKGDSIQGMVPLGDLLVIFGGNGLVVISANSGIDFTVRAVIGPRDGAIHFRGCCEVAGKALHAGRSGLYLFDGATDRLLTADLDRAWRSLIRGLEVDPHNIPVVYDDAYKLVRLGVSAVFPSVDAGEWLLDLPATDARGYPVWFSSAHPVGGYLPWDGEEPLAVNTRRLFAWPRDYGALVELNIDGGGFVTETNFADDPDPQTAVFETGDFTLAGLVANFIAVHLECIGASGSLSCEAILDGRVICSIPYPTPTGLPLYGAFTYGELQYGGQRYRVLPADLPLDMNGRMIRLRVTYTGLQRFTLLGLTVLVVPESAPRGFES